MTNVIFLFPNASYLARFWCLGHKIANTFFEKRNHLHIFALLFIIPKSPIMPLKYSEYEQLSLTQTAKEIAEIWEKNDIFQKSIENRRGNPNFTFYEGPPSANGLPGIHHVMARAIKDIFCRYKTLKGFKVDRKGGWDTHGLPVELGVEKSLGITKEDIGKKISVEDYNKACREEVMKYKNSFGK